MEVAQTEFTIKYLYLYALFFSSFNPVNLVCFPQNLVIMVSKATMKNNMHYCK